MATETGQRVTKKKRAAAASSCRVTLPDHLVAEVLARLPARSLARLRCACRSWDAEISSRAFQERHHALAAPKFALLQLAPPHLATWEIRIGSRRPAPFITGCKDCPGVVGSKPCFGLVLVVRRCDAAYFVCNPTTGETLRLPPPPHQKRCATGLGFHASAGEFKVVRVSIQSGKLHSSVLTVSDAAKGWRSPAAATSLVDFNDDDTMLEPYAQPVFADGCLHWMFRTEYLDKPQGILSFSLADESFRRVAQPSFSTADLVPFDYVNGYQQPHEYQRWRACGVRSESGEEVSPPAGKTLAELDGRLCMMRDVRHRGDVGGGGLLFEIWKLQDYAAGSWSLDYRIDLTPGGHMAERLTTPWLVVPLSYLGGGGGSVQEGGKKLLLATTEREAYVYDQDSGTLQTVASGSSSRDGNNSVDNSLRLVLYKESLVRFTGMEQGKRKIKFVKVEYN